MPRHRAIFDCNIFLQAMLSTHGASHGCWLKVLDGEVDLFIAPFILAEIRSLPGRRNLRRFTQFTADAVERFIEELLEFSRLVPDPPNLFFYSRDPDDAPYIGLAISTGSLLIVSRDKDLLSLMSDDNPDGKALRENYAAFRVLSPPEFLSSLRADRP